MFSKRARTLLLCAVVLALPSVANSDDQRDERRDLYFGEAIYYALQGDYFSALERLDAELAQHYAVDERRLDSLYSHLDRAEFSVGDFELHYRMHHRAGRAIRRVLESDVEPAIRIEAAYRLAKLHFQKNQSSDALAVLESLEGPIPDALQDDIEFLRAQLLLALDRPKEAIELFRSLRGSKGVAGFSEYNLGIALLEDDRFEAAVAQLDRAGRIKVRDRETQAIRDKSNLVVGSMLFEAERFPAAQKFLNRVRLEGPFSNQALLHAGWAHASDGDFERALVPWSVLAERNATDSAVQEARLALPHAYSSLNVHGRAAVLYERAAKAFGVELVNLNASIESIERGDFRRALEREEIRLDKDWLIRMRNLPEAPETFYLATLMASHAFQTALQNYLDLVDMRRKLVDWQRALIAFEDMIEYRRAYYEPRIPEIDARFRRLDAQIRLRREQQKHLDERLTKMLTAPDPEMLTTAEEYRQRARLDVLQGRIEALGDSAMLERIRRLRGALQWRIETDYHERLTTAHDHLRQLNSDVLLLDARYADFVRTRQAAMHSYVGYDSTIDLLSRKVERAITRIDDLKEKQGRALDRVASRELQSRKGRLEAYQNRARFAFADSYDRAAKMRTESGE